MPLEIVRKDITTIPCDAIVNAAKNSLLGGGGVDGAIHNAAGPGLLEECRTLGGCETGDAKITKGYELPCKYVIHTVGPMWYGGGYDEENLLRSCYRRSLSVAAEHYCESVAFPLISAGIYGYPKDQALHIAIEEISDFLRTHEMLVYLAFRNKSSYDIGTQKRESIVSFIEDRYTGKVLVPPASNGSKQQSWHEVITPNHSVKAAFNSEENPFDSIFKIFNEKDDRPSAYKEDNHSIPCDARPCDVPPPELAKRLTEMDESFAQSLLRRIDERGVTDAECYKKANIDRRLFSKIRSDAGYRPTKATVLAFAIALELSEEETNAFLKTAGYALSSSCKFDVIVQYFIERGIYNVFEINEVLFAFDQNLLGGV